MSDPDPEVAVGRADRALVWLVLLTLVLGGLATTAVIFGADAVLANLSQSSAASEHVEDEHAHSAATSGAMPHDMGAGADHAMPTGMAQDMGAGHAMPTGMAQDMGADSGHAAEMPEALRLHLWAAYKADQAADAARAHEHLQAAAGLAHAPELKAAIEGLLGGHAGAEHGASADLGPALRDLLGGGPEPDLSLAEIEREIERAPTASH